MSQLLASDRLRGLYSGRPEYGIKEPRKALLQLISAYRDQPMGAVHPRMGHPRLAQHLEMVRQRALGHRCLNRAARLLPLRQRSDDLQPDRVAQCVQHVRECDLVDARVVEGPHAVVRTIANLRSTCFAVAPGVPSRELHLYSYVARREKAQGVYATGPTSTSTAATTCGSNWEPAPASSSRRALSTLSGARYGRCETI